MSMSKISSFAIGILLTIVGIYIFKWINSQYKLPVIGDMIENV